LTVPVGNAATCVAHSYVALSNPNVVTIECVLGRYAGPGQGKLAYLSFQKSSETVEVHQLRPALSEAIPDEQRLFADLVAHLH